MLLKENERRGKAEKIALDAGVLAQCPYHEEIIDPLKGDNTPAYQLGARLFDEGELDGLFDSVEQLRDTISNAIKDAGPECYICEKHSQSD